MTKTPTKNWDELSDADRKRYERKAARMLSPEQAAKAKAPKPPTPQARKKAARREALPASGPLIVLSKRQRPTRSQDGRLQRNPGEIVSHPDALDLKVLQGAAEPLSEWWGADFEQPQRDLDGKIFPVLRQRPADKRLWIQDEPKHLLELNAASDGLALQALRRCREPQLLELVPANTSRTLLRAAAEAKLANPYGEGERPLSLLLDGRELVVLREGLDTIEAGELRRHELAVLIGTCEDAAALQAVLNKRALRDNHQDATARLAQLKTEADAKAEKAEEAGSAAGAPQPPAEPDAGLGPALPEEGSSEAEALKASVIADITGAAASAAGDTGRDKPGPSGKGKK